MRRGQAVALAAFGIFLAITAMLSLLVVLTLLWPRSSFAGMWMAKPAAFAGLLGARPAATVGFAVLAAILGVAAIRWHRRERLGWCLALLVIAANLAADVATLAATRQATDLLAPCVDGLVLVWLLAPATRSPFNRPARHGGEG